MIRYAYAAAAAILACAPASAAPVVAIDTPKLVTGTTSAFTPAFDITTVSRGGTPDIFDGSTITIDSGSSLDVFYARSIAPGLDEVKLEGVTFLQPAFGTLTLFWGLEFPGQLSGSTSIQLDGRNQFTILDVPKAKFFSFRGTQQLEVLFVVFTAVPEPATWAMMIGGFGLVGASLRARRRPLVGVGGQRGQFSL